MDHARTPHLRTARQVVLIVRPCECGTARRRICQRPRTGPMRPLDSSRTYYALPATGPVQQRPFHLRDSVLQRPKSKLAPEDRVEVVESVCGRHQMMLMGAG